MKYIALYESWMREEIIVLTSRQGRTITIELTHGKIQRIDNESGVYFPYVENQPFQTPFVKAWACKNNFKWNGQSACDPGEKKIFGIKTKYVPKGHEWRQIFPGKFKK
ncbi:hypothetical protein UFOVP699_209 [uncultured Caudovirales phage]|uniref:Uncharacterized protein n=1 Tax=uncultured Caudovirales phage TaxID=2100421 RepID=A0A6J5NKQ8_9CAUD|nr:hypothetical protein UFOVP699_209 [uncultured Caudovirales phage]